jgi:myo-inositol 2-dehydrogenase/D-chiro-inositol 1-dehydrogenase
MSSRVISVGVVGAGAVASSVHLPILTRRSDLFKVAAIADFNIEAANAIADRFGIDSASRYSTPEAMVSSGKIEAIVILNSGSHCNVVVDALNGGLDVFCEKPLAYSKEELTRIEIALKSSGNKLMIGYMKTYDQAVGQARKAIKSRPRTVDVVVLHPNGESQLATSELHVKAFAASKELVSRFTQDGQRIEIQALGMDAAQTFGNFYSDVILGSVIHELSVLRALDIHISEVDYVDYWPLDRKAESIIVHARTADGVRVTIRWFYLDQYPLYQEEIRWISETEGHHIIFPSPYILRVPTKLISTRRLGLDHSHTVFESYQSSFEIELNAFHNLVLTGEQIGDPIADANEDLRISQQIARKMAELHNIPIGGNLADL